ncbi:GPI mannosyltransferase 1 [Coemansia asiatica]|uniref:GPI mannosyltransferase 1 n=1 Tax=Coemansia asiatica TaxID=1052880 RepID=A0A9W8CMG1_9FUNG|nr:GPI mannosyltransferase 1 [Coemansia asiatica]KAJ2877983.1 GPI mannosyltransferase 1 [Coemansia asiatica]
MQHLLTPRNVFVGGLLLRIGMLFFGLWQDANMTVKYTDIDYSVFTDAARYVWDGHSPYQRSTYRYTPLLALLLTPNIWLHPTFGKWLFVFCDCVVGFLIVRILKARGTSDQRAASYAALWLLNPQVATISTRGSAESVVCAAVMASLYALQRRSLTLASALFGLSVHLKIYPIIYALPILVALDSVPYGNASVSQAKLINAHRIWFFVVSAGIFLVLSALMYAVYGIEFVEETYLYHVTRKDHRHNYSMWYLPIYLEFQSKSSVLMGLLSFLPQALSVGTIGLAFGKDVYFAAFAQTFAFVTYNKVCTSQYFMWYICFLPVIWPYNSQKLLFRGAALLATWLGTQALYLQQAYRLEFLGENTFTRLWLAGLVIFASNNLILCQIVKSQQIMPLFVTKTAFKKIGSKDD